MEAIAESLKTLRKPIVFAGVGNIFLSDDGAGPVLADKITNPEFLSVNCGATPENFISKLSALNAETIIIIDAADLNSPPGSYSLIPADQIANASISTHALSLGMLAQYLCMQRSVNIFMLAIQPLTISHGTQLSAPVLASITRLASIINGSHES